jgi:predicted glycosyltransferase
MHTFQPDAFIADYLPLGMDHELAPLLASSPGCRKYFVLRGILGDPQSLHLSVFTPPAMEALRQHYDMILATCDPRIVNIAEEYALTPDLVDKLVYTGYAVEPYNADACSAARADRLLPEGATWVVCSAGGGKDGEDLLQKCWELALQYPECYFDLIIGPRSRFSLHREGWYGGTRIRVMQSDEGTMPYRLGGADVVISRGGYNSLMEAAVGNAQIIVAPIRTDYEQVHHARRLSQFRPLHVVDDIDDLDRTFEHVLTLPRSPHRLTDLRLDGLATSARVILSDLAQAANLNVVASTHPPQPERILL